MEWDEHHRRVTPLQHLANYRRAPCRKFLSPPERHEIRFRLGGRPQDLFLAATQPDLHGHLADPPRAVAGYEFLAPRRRLVLRLVGEGGQRAFTVNVQHDDLHVRVRSELDQRPRCERRCRRPLEWDENAIERVDGTAVRRNDDNGLQQ